MQRKKTWLPLYFSLVFGSVVLASCSKQNAGPDENGTAQQGDISEAATADQQAASVFDETSETVIGFDSKIGAGSGVGLMYNSNAREDSAGRCFSVSITPLTPGVFPKTVVLDFGNGCTDRKGTVRKGKITTVYSGYLAIAGSTSVTSFQNYFVDSVQVEGVLTVKNTSTSAGFSFDMSVAHGKLSSSSGKVVQWNSDRKWVQSAGQETPLRLGDDSYSITGNSAGTVKNDTKTTTYTTEIINPLSWSATCRWITAGTVKITKNDKEGLIDFGDGDCDRKAKLIVDGTTINISLR